MTSSNRSVEIRRARRFETATLPAASGRGAAGGHQCILSEGGIVNRAVSEAAGPRSWSPRIIEHSLVMKLSCAQVGRVHDDHCNFVDRFVCGVDRRDVMSLVVTDFYVLCMYCFSFRFARMYCIVVACK